MYNISLTLSIDVYTIYIHILALNNPAVLSFSACLKLTQTHSRTQPCSSRALMHIKKEGQ
jgi:hypothetical protein